MNDEEEEDLESEEEDLYEEFDVIVVSLTRRLIKCELEDFELASHKFCIHFCKLCY
jgi:hypothetical protein